jgi:vitamin B12 transporter
LPGRYNKHGGEIGNPEWRSLADSQSINFFGAYGTEKYSLNASIFGNRAGNHFLYRDYYDFTRRKEGSEVLDAGASVSFLRNAGDHSKIIASLSFYYGDKNIPVSGYASNYSEQRDLSSRANLMLDMPRAFHDDFAMELSLGHNWNKINFDQGASSSIHDEHNLSLINRWSWYPGAKFTLRFGGDYRFIHLDSTDTGLRYGNRGGLYVTSEYSPVKPLLLIASVKGTSNGREITPVPKLGLSWSINQYFTLRNNYFRSFKFPDFNDLYWAQGGFTGNPDLKNEDGWGADLGVDFSFKAINFSSTVYGAWIRDSIHWSNLSGTWRPENSGTAAFSGWDNRLELSIPFSPGPLEKPLLVLSWLFQPSWLLSGDLSFSDALRIPYMPMHTFMLSLEIPWKTAAKKLPGSLSVSGRYESIRFADTRNINELDPSFLLNATYNQRVSQNFSLFGKINNALNTGYVSFADYPMPGISFCFGLGFDVYKK